MIALLRNLTGSAGNAFYFCAGVTAHIFGFVIISPFLSKIAAAGQFPHDHQVNPLEPVFFQRRKIMQRRVCDDRPEIAEQVELGADT